MIEIFNDRRKSAIAILSAVLVVIIALIAWWLFQPKKIAETNINQTGNTVLPITNSEPAQIEPASPAQVQEANSYPLGLRQVASTFAERYGSYSSDQPDKSLADLAPYLTERFAAELKNAPADSIKSQVFTGYTTRALSMDLVNVSASSAEIIVKTQRTQTIDSASKTFYASLKLTAQKSGDSWKIDSAKWQ